MPLEDAESLESMFMAIILAGFVTWRIDQRQHQEGFGAPIKIARRGPVSSASAAPPYRIRRCTATSGGTNSSGNIKPLLKATARQT